MKKGTHGLSWLLNHKVNLRINVASWYSEEIQELCFSKGIYWNDGAKHVRRTSEKTLYIINCYYDDTESRYWIGTQDDMYSEFGDDFEVDMYEDLVWYSCDLKYAIETPKDFRPETLVPVEVDIDMDTVGFDTVAEAVIARNNYIIENNLQNDFEIQTLLPEDKAKLEQLIADGLVIEQLTVK